jgi:hypothetical protein
VQSINVFIDPPSEHFENDELFNLNNQSLNRDGTLLPFHRIKEALSQHGIELHTADLLINNKIQAQRNLYWTTGIMKNYENLASRKDVELCGAILFEPPLVAPHMYAQLPLLTKHFSTVYVHNIHGDGYDMAGVDQSKLRQLYWPQPYNCINENAWAEESRSRKLVVIAGNHNPLGRKPEFYSTRIEAIAQLSKLDAVDLYGRGWTRWLSRQSLWMPYWLNLRSILKTYRGACESKAEVLKKYHFCLCLENFPMSGYVTEKIFDCLYSGTIPVYLGAPDIKKLIPEDCYIHVEKNCNWNNLYQRLSTLNDSEISRMKLAGRRFIESDAFQKYYINFLSDEFVKNAV